MKKLYLASKVILNITTITFGASLLIGDLLENDQIKNQVGLILKDQGYTETINTGKEPIRYKTWYTSVQDVIKGNDDISKAAESEGAVLLRNENNALPLDVKKDKVSLFGVTSYDPMYSLDGAGEVKINKERQQFFYDEFSNAGLTMNSDLASWYQSNTQYNRKDYINIYDNTTNKNGANAALNGANWSVLPESKAKEGFNTGVFIVGRMTNEGIDLKANNVKDLGAKDDDYLKFTDNELSVLQGMKELKDAGKLNKIVVLFNQANPMTDNLEEIFDKYGVDSAMWIGFPGSGGIRAVSDLLTGKVSPSGGLSTTWYKSKEAHPSYNYFANNNEVIIQEGMYLGYKYSETRYEDALLNKGNTANYIYKDNVSYPFGYGLSYATFDQKNVGVELDKDPNKNYNHKNELLPKEKQRKEGDDYIVKVEVTNTSSTVAAKEIVQLYAQKPYLESDKEHQVEKPSVELVGFAKTKKLQPGEKQVLEIELDANKYFASYDKINKNYVLSAGDYYLAASRNSHEAINSILKAKAGLDESKLDITFGAGDVASTHKIQVSNEYAKNYKYWTKGEAEVTNLFDHVDPNIISGDANYVKFASRSDWGATFDDAQHQIITLKGDMAKGKETHRGNGFSYENAKKHYPEAIEKFENAYPKYRDASSNGNLIQLSSMIGVEYEPSRGASEEDIKKWNDFMDQLTWEETVTLVGSGLRKTEAIESIGKPYTNDVNASNAISWKFDMTLAGGEGKKEVGFANRFDAGDRDHNPTGYPCEGIVAATFNKDLAYAVGQAIGEDGLWSGASGLYGFGLGLHRNPYHGRAGEYYSEDPYLTGIIGGYSSKGAQSKGLYVYNKHFVLNDQETNRTSYNTWLTEQTMRETYLRPFEIAIEIGDAMNVMNSFNNIGSGWSGNDYNLMTKCLREEFDMRGFAVTDYYQSGGMNMTYGALAGTDLPDGSAIGQIKGFGPEKGGYGFLAQAYRQSAQRILYTVANSNAMNFIGDDTKIIVHEPKWIGVFDTLHVSMIVLFALGLAFYLGNAGYLIYKKIRK